MVSKTFAVSFYLKKPKRHKGGPVAIYLRITIDGKRAEISTKSYCDAPEKWSPAWGRMTGTQESVNH